MTEYEQLIFRKQAIDRDINLAYYEGGEGVYTVGGCHLGKSWKTAQKARNGKNHWRVKSGKLAQKRNKVSKNTEKHF